MTREDYTTKRQGLTIREVNYGVSGVELFTADDLDAGQEGYAGDPDWSDAWLVIGRETGVGDPIILDTQSGQVLTAEHGQGEWSPDPVAASVDGFFAVIEALAEVAKDRDNPVALQKNPLTSEERERFVECVRSANPGIDPWWWESLLDNGDDPPS